MSFEKIFTFTLQWEGGSKITDDPDDPGGLTKYGLSKRANPDLDIANLTEDQAKEIYKERYWNKVALELDPLLDMASYDTAVNAGVPRVLRWLTECPDYQSLLHRRRQHYFEITDKNPKLSKYTKGWENRVDALSHFLETEAINA